MTKRIVAAAVVLLVFFSPVAFSVSPRPIEPVPQELFRPVPVLPAPTLRESQPIPTSAVAWSHPEPPTPTKPPIVVPTAGLKVVVVAEPVPRGRALSGRASWYCRPGVSICAKGFPAGGSYAAADPALRAAICGVQSCTSWRGRTVYVDGIRVKLIDWCQCYWKQPHEKIIDLYYNVFRQVGGDVTITW